MDYIIKNHKNVFIRLNGNGKAVTCTEGEKTLFEYSKARNILDNLPKTLRRLNFKVEPITEIIPSSNKKVVEIIKENIIKTQDYELSENISRWIEKFGSCSDVFDEAYQTLEILMKGLENADKELMDILHNIELEKSRNLYHGWLLYKSIRENRKRRRIIKDETLIIENVLEQINPSCLKRERIQKAINGLFTRKYRFRIVEEGIEDANM